MRIGEIAERTGVSVRALRYYEENGLLAPGRTPSGQRVYDDAAIEKVNFIQTLFAAGINSRTVAHVLPCVDTGHTNAEQRRLLHAEHHRLRNKVRDLETAADRLSALIDVTRDHRSESV